MEAQEGIYPHLLASLQDAFMGMGRQGYSVVILPRPLATFWNAFGIGSAVGFASESSHGAWRTCLPRSRFDLAEAVLG